MLIGLVCSTTSYKQKFLVKECFLGSKTEPVDRQNQVVLTTFAHGIQAC